MNAKQYLFGVIFSIATTQAAEIGISVKPQEEQKKEVAKKESEQESDDETNEIVVDSIITFDTEKILTERLNRIDRGYIDGTLKLAKDYGSTKRPTRAAAIEISGKINAYCERMTKDRNALGKSQFFNMFIACNLEQKIFEAMFQNDKKALKLIKDEEWDSLITSSIEPQKSE